MAAYRRVYDSRHLQADCQEQRDQLWNPTLCNRVLATFFTRVSQYQKGILTNMDFTEARDSEWQWHQLGHMQVCTSPLTDNHASTPPLRFLQAECPSCTFQWHSIAVSVTHLSGSFECVFARLTAACRPN